MKMHFFLAGIAILFGAQSMCAADALSEAGMREKSPRFDSTIVLVPVVPDTPNPLPAVSDTINLQEAVVKANFAQSSRSPLRLATLDARQMGLFAALRTYPELLGGIPGLYATSESGGYGDAKMNIRGFSQDNIAVLVNGIPISGLVSGGMYWNNWAGLCDATFAVQVQKGVGSSMLADGSVGGAVNIITESPSEEFTIEASFCGSAWGASGGSLPGHCSVGGGPFKGCLKIGGGPIGHGWSMNLVASYTGGDGYVEATAVSSFAYMFNLAKTFRGGHRLIFTALGSPEQHGQRSSRLSAAEIGNYGLQYSKNWGWRDGKVFNLSRNRYFKPYFTLQHLCHGGKLSMKNSVYLAIGNGGGRWTQTKGAGISSFTTDDGHIDWDAAIASNRNPDGSANSIISTYMAGHTQLGAIVSASYRICGHWKIESGLHGQFYSTWERERIDDLLGADWWYEDYETESLAALAGRNPVKTVGDFIRTDNGKKILHGTAYAASSCTYGKLSAELGASLFCSSNRRWDRYNYTGSDIYSDKAAGVGSCLKGGILWHPLRAHSFYINGGWYSRLPYSSVWFSSGNNEITRGVANEKNTLGELGWRCVWESGNLELTAYAVYWQNKSLMSDKYRQADSEDARYMVTGLDALHCGVEVAAFRRIGRVAELEAFASVGDWRWRNDVSAIIYDDYSGTEKGRVNVYCDNLPVADAPQTQIGASVKINAPYGFSAGADWRFNGRMYADFDPLTRTDPQDRSASYRIPSYHLLGASLKWEKDFPTCRRSAQTLSLCLFVRGDNLLDITYIERGKDGESHNLETFRGYWGFGRAFSFGLRVRMF